MAYQWTRSTAYLEGQLRMSPEDFEAEWKLAIHEQLIMLNETLKEWMETVQQDTGYRMPRQERVTAAKKAQGGVPIGGQ